MRLRDNDLDRQLQAMTEELNRLPEWMRAEDSADDTAHSGGKQNVPSQTTCE